MLPIVLYQPTMPSLCWQPLRSIRLALSVAAADANSSTQRKWIQIQISRITWSSESCCAWNDRTPSCPSNAWWPCCRWPMRRWRMQMQLPLRSNTVQSTQRLMVNNLLYVVACGHRCKQARVNVHCRNKELVRVWTHKTQSNSMTWNATRNLSHAASDGYRQAS